jgi:hypothetical protein
LLDERLGLIERAQRATISEERVGRESLAELEVERSLLNQWRVCVAPAAVAGHRSLAVEFCHAAQGREAMSE